MAYFAKREQVTTLPCPDCAKPLTIARSCFEVFMLCPNCQKRFPLKPFIKQSDAAMEEFMENVYCNRI
ncbi:MAG: hypothetical protein IJS54_00605 [Desulfovibrio sp.]|nr:hypothetical protein [Desulfovibrio sp.]